jgi:hypothetical protein
VKRLQLLVYDVWLIYVCGVWAPGLQWALDSRIAPFVPIAVVILVIALVLL